MKTSDPLVLVIALIALIVYNITLLWFTWQIILFTGNPWWALLGVLFLAKQSFSYSAGDEDE